MTYEQSEPPSDIDYLAGVLPVFQIPFDDGMEIAFDELRFEIDWLFDNGASGIVLGMVSEVLRLSSPERDAVADVACRAAAGRGPVVVSVTAESTYVAVQHARTAESVGAGAVMCTLPISGRVLPDEAIRHFEQIVAATQLPVVVQDASGYIGHELPIETMAHLQERFPDRVLFKPETPPLGQRMSELLAATDGRARIYEGSGGVALVDAYRRGVFGTMPAADLIWAIVALWSALEKGDAEMVRAIRGPLTTLISLQGQLDAFVSIEKHLLVAQGVLSSARMRGPSGFVVDPETLDDAKALMLELQGITAR